MERSRSAAAPRLQLALEPRVLRVLELRDYRDRRRSDAFIADRLGIPHDEAQRCLKALAESRLIARRAGRWVVKQVLAVDTRRNPEAGRTLKAHWAGVGLQRLPQLEPVGQDLFSYNLFTVSEKDWERLRDLHIAYFRSYAASSLAHNPPNASLSSICSSCASTAARERLVSRLRAVPARAVLARARSARLDRQCSRCTVPLDRSV